LVRRYRQQPFNMRAASSARGLRNLVDLEPVSLPLARYEEKIVVSRRDEELFDIIVFKEGCRVRALTPAPLAPIRANRDAFHEAFVGDENHHLLALYQVLDIDLFDFVDHDFGPSLVPVFLRDGKSLGFNNLSNA